MPAKNRNSARGAQIDCLNFEMCPLCYGCRNYNTQLPECQKCLKDPKNNICNLQSHKAHLVARMITKQKINVDQL